jgi:thioredoxin-like negative regulator of GroEL
VIAKIDCDKAEESISSSHGVSGIPAVFLYINGARVDCKKKKK